MTSSSKQSRDVRRGNVHRSERSESWVLVTDLDGTLLDRTYDLQAAATALNRVLANWPVVEEVVLATSKTVSELLPLATLLDRPPILVYENGAGFAAPAWEDDQPGGYSYRATDQGRSYQSIREILVRLRDRDGLKFRAFGDMSPCELVELTGLDIESARLARQRHASEPLLWSDSRARFERFQQALQAEGLVLVSGGQFHHVSSPANKWEAVSKWREQRLPHASVLACGDAPNDEQLLRFADRSIVFPGKEGSRLLPESRRVTHADALGPDGWLKAVNGVLAEITSTSSSHGIQA